MLTGRSARGRNAPVCACACAAECASARVRVRLATRLATNFLLTPKAHCARLGLPASCRCRHFASIRLNYASRLTDADFAAADTSGQLGAGSTRRRALSMVGGAFKFEWPARMLVAHVARAEPASR